MSNSKVMLIELGRKCDRSHSHKTLHGKDCEMAAFYPLKLIRAILKGIALQAAEDKLRRQEARDNLRNVQQIKVYAARAPNAKTPISKVLGKLSRRRRSDKIRGAGGGVG